MPKTQPLSRTNPTDLTEPQQESVRRLRSLIQQFSQSTSTEQSGDREPEDNRTEEEKYGMFGLFGARGSGKSTVLEIVLDQVNASSEGILVCQPSLDCTTLPRHIPLGLSLVSHVKRFIDDLQVRPPEEGKEKATPSADLLRDLTSNFADTWEKLVARYVETDQRHHELQLNLAVTQSEYQSIAKHEIESRATLSDSVQKWLDAGLKLASARSSKQWRHILLALEDADLGTGPVSLRVVSTFLDELKDERLMFIVVADEHNLEERFRKGARREFSVHMTPQVLAKVVPVHHRVYLDPWNHEGALKFAPLPGKLKGKTPSLAEVLDDRLKVAKGSKPEEISLKARDLTLLLPRYPRGLSDMYRGLLEFAGDEQGAQEPLPPLDDPALVLLLARARGDLALARNLPLRPLRWWGLHLHWPDDATSQGRRRQREQIIDRDWPQRPLWAFAPLSLPFELRGDEDAVLWAELLLNISFRSNPDAIRHFIRRFKPLGDQLGKCSFRFQPTKFELVRLGQMSPTVLDSPWFLWHGEGRESAKIEAGWSPIVERSMGQPWSDLADILKDLGVAPFEPSSTGDRAEQAGILPKDVRSLLLLVDEVSQLPWDEMLGWAEAQFLEYWPPLLALFCGGAYLGTLYECLYPISQRHDMECPPEVKAINRLYGRASKLAKEALQDKFAGSGARNLGIIVREIDQFDWGTKPLDHPMTDATRAFFNSTAVRDLLPDLRTPPALKS